MPEPRTLTLPQRLARAYSAHMQGILYPGSEADTPYEPFTTPFDPANDLTVATFRAVVRLAALWTVDLGSGDEWFDRKIASAKDPNAGDDPDAAVAYDHLRRTMEATLVGPLVAGSASAQDVWRFHKTRHYIFGSVAGGGLAGLVAYSVET